VGQGIQELFIARDEILLLLFVELARDNIWLVILQPQPMQKRDQSRTAFINEPEFLLDKGPDLACRTRERRADPRLQNVLLLHTQIASAPAHIEAGDAPSIPRCSNSLRQPRIVSSSYSSTWATS